MEDLNRKMVESTILHETRIGIVEDKVERLDNHLEKTLEILRKDLDSNKNSHQELHDRFLRFENKVGNIETMMSSMSKMSTKIFYALVIGIFLSSVGGDMETILKAFKMIFAL